MKDLVVLVADKSMQFALRGALGRPEAMGIRSFQPEFIVHPNRDGGVRRTGTDILRLKRHTAEFALLLLDYEGCGAECSPAELEADLDRRLARDWGARAKAIVIAPELEVWMWGSDNSLETCLGWNRPTRVREWLAGRGFEFSADGKPRCPKESLEAALKELKLPRSAALYEEIAASISLRRCRDTSFRRLREQLIRWFPAG